MLKLMKQKLVLFKKQKVKIILTKNVRTFSMLYFFVGTNSSLSFREKTPFFRFKINDGHYLQIFAQIN